MARALASSMLITSVLRLLCKRRHHKKICSLVDNDDFAFNELKDFLLIALVEHFWLELSFHWGYQ
jgi:hypothetical protein